MPRRNKAVPSSRYKIFAIPPTGGTPVLLALVESFQATDNYTPEFLQGLGDAYPVDSVLNTGSGAFRYNGVSLPANRDRNRILRPEAARFAEYEEFRILAVDTFDQEPVTLCVGCMPQMFETDTSNGRALRESYVGGCRQVLRGAEAKEASS